MKHGSRYVTENSSVSVTEFGIGMKYKQSRPEALNNEKGRVSLLRMEEKTRFSKFD